MSLTHEGAENLRLNDKEIAELPKHGEAIRYGWKSKKSDSVLIRCEISARMQKRVAAIRNHEPLEDGRARSDPSLGQHQRSCDGDRKLLEMFEKQAV